MTLKKKIENLRKITTLLQEGWDNKMIFVNQSAYTQKSKGSWAVFPGWETVIKEANNDLCAANIVYGDYGALPVSVAEYLTEAKAFLQLVDNGPKSPPEFRPLSYSGR